MTRTSTSAGLAALLLSLAAVPLHAQELRFALLDADLVTVARQLGKQSFDDNVDLHKVQVIQTLRSGGGTIPVTVTAIRRDGFAGDIGLALASAPAGFVLSGARVRTQP